MRLLTRIFTALGLAVAAYLAIVLAGLIPVNNGFEPALNGVELFIVSNPVHADIVLPLHTETIDWREHFAEPVFRGSTRRATHIAIGWGDKRFFLETPTWADLRASTAAQAMFWPTVACMHVSMTRAEDLPEDSRSVTISVAQYERLVRFINDSFQRTAEGSRIQISGFAYGLNDAFFEANGKYHCLNTCNCWVGRAMQEAGIRTGWLTPLPKTVFLYLP